MIILFLSNYCVKVRFWTIKSTSIVVYIVTYRFMVLSRENPFWCVVKFLFFIKINKWGLC